MAVVIASAISKVEVAVGLALFAGFTADPGEQLFALVVVAGSEALGVVVVDETVSIIIDAVSAQGDPPGAFDNVTLSGAATRTSHRARATRTSHCTGSACTEAAGSSGASGSNHAARPAASGRASGSDEGVAARAATAGTHRENEGKAKHE
jgi:hypothetical protein